MPVTLSLELSSRDLAFFRRVVREARKAIRDADDADVLHAIDSAIDALRTPPGAPDFIERYLPALDHLTAMLRDDDWRLPKAERERLLATLIYLADPDDLIPDDIPGIGFLDDAIMLELLLKEMRHVREAYAEFCDYRATYRERYRTGHDEATRNRRLGKRRSQLHARMRRRTTRSLASQKISVLW